MLLSPVPSIMLVPNEVFCKHKTTRPHHPKILKSPNQATDHQSRHLLTRVEHPRRPNGILTRHVAMCHRAHLGARNLRLKVDAKGIQNRRVCRRRRRWRGRTQLVGRVDRRRHRRLGSRHGERAHNRSERSAEAALSITDKGPPIGKLLRNRSRKRAVTARGGLRPDGGSWSCRGRRSWRGGGRLIALGVRTRSMRGRRNVRGCRASL